MSTFERVISVIADQFSIDKDSITKDTSLIDDLNIDSLDVVELLVSLEEEFNISIDDEVGSKMKTVQDIVNHLENNLE